VAQGLVSSAQITGILRSASLAAVTSRYRTRPSPYSTCAGLGRFPVAAPGQGRARRQADGSAAPIQCCPWHHGPGGPGSPFSARRQSRCWPRSASRQRRHGRDGPPPSSLPPPPSTQGTGRPRDPPQRPAGVHCRAPWAATGPGSSASASPSRPIAARQSRRSARACCERRSGIRPQAWYPAAGRLQAGNSRPAAGPFPLIVFAPGFRQGGTPYSRLLQAWASAGFVVAG